MAKILTIFAVFLCAVFSLKAQSANIDHDFEFWSDTSLTIPLVKKEDKKGEKVEKLNFFISGTFRAGNNISRAIDERIGAGFDYHLNKYLTLTTSYLYRAGQPPTGGKDFEHRIRFEATPGYKWKHFSLRDRNRFEYRFRNSRPNSTRYRNRLTFTVPVKKDGKELFAPFAADEVFYDFREGKWNRNEFSAGISKKFNKTFTADFYYLIQNNRATTLKYVNVIGVNLKFKLTKNPFSSSR